MNTSQRSGLFALLSVAVLSGCAPAPATPVVDTPAAIVQAPDPAVLHKIWEAGYAAGYRQAQRFETRRDEQQIDQMGNVPMAENLQPRPTPAAPGLTPVATGLGPSLFQPTGPAIPVSAGD